MERLERSHDLEKLTLPQLFKLLRLRDWGWVFGIVFTIAVGAYKFGFHQGPQEPGFRLIGQAESALGVTYTLEAGRATPIIGAEVIAALDSYPDGEPQRLRLAQVQGWSDSPTGPFAKETGFDGPTYFPGSRTFVLLSDQRVWSITTLSVAAHEIEILVSGPAQAPGK